MKMPTALPSSPSSRSRARTKRAAPPGRAWPAAAIAVIAAIGCAPARVTVPFPVPVPDAGAGLPRFELKGNVMAWNGEPLRFGDRLETWTRALGPPSSVTEARARWFGDSVELWSRTTVDHRAYAARLLVRLGAEGFPGVFVLQGVPLFRGAPPLAAVQRALLATDTPLEGLGARGPETARMRARGPDGFEVTVAAELGCPHPPPERRGQCEQATIDRLEIGADEP